MKKSTSFFVKLIVLIVLMLQMSLTLQSYADMIIPDIKSDSKTKDIRTKYTYLNEDITKAIDSFEKLKNPSLREKGSYKKEFKSLLIKCSKLQDEISSGLRLINKRKAEATKEWQKATDEYHKKNTEPPSDSGYSYYRRAPRNPEGRFSINDIVIANENLEIDEKRLKEYLIKLGVNDFNFLNNASNSSVNKEKNRDFTSTNKENPLENNIFLIAGLTLIIIIALSVLKFIPHKKSS